MSARLLCVAADHVRRPKRGPITVAHVTARRVGLKVAATLRLRRLLLHRCNIAARTAATHLYCVEKRSLD